MGKEEGLFSNYDVFLPVLYLPRSVMNPWQSPEELELNTLIKERIKVQVHPKILHSQNVIPPKRWGRRFSVHLTLGQLGHLGAAPCGKCGLQKRYQNQWCPLEAPAVPIKEGGVLKEVKVSRRRWWFLKGSVLLHLVQQKITVTCISWRRGQISFVSRLGISPENWQWKDYWDGRQQAQPMNLKVKDPEGNKAPSHCIRSLCLWAWGEGLLLTTEWLPCAPLKTRPGQESPT